MAPHLLEIGAGETSLGSLAPLPLPPSESVTGKLITGFLELSKCIYQRKNERRLRPDCAQNTFVLIKIICKRCVIWCLLLFIAFLIQSVKAPELCLKLSNPLTSSLCVLVYTLFIASCEPVLHTAVLKSR